MSRFIPKLLLVDLLVDVMHWQGNTALHYAVSQCNIGIMQTLLDTGVCDVRRQNRAGYTAIMLASLLIIDANDAHRDVIRRLFAVGDVNVKSATVCITVRKLTRDHSNKPDHAEGVVEGNGEVNIPLRS